MRTFLIVVASLAMLVSSAQAQVKEIKGPGGMVCNYTNSCACKATLKACVACNNQWGVDAQTNWCKATNPALR